MANRPPCYEVDRRARAQLRAAVLRIGELLGWEPNEVIAFTEDITDCPWRRCSCAEFQAVLDEYLAMGRVIQQKAERRRLHEQQTILPTRNEGGRDVSG